MIIDTFENSSFKNCCYSAHYPFYHRIHSKLKKIQYFKKKTVMNNKKNLFERINKCTKSWQNKCVVFNNVLIIYCLIYDLNSQIAYIINIFLQSGAYVFCMSKQIASCSITFNLLKLGLSQTNVCIIFHLQIKFT